MSIIKRMLVGTLDVGIWDTRADMGAAAAADAGACLERLLSEQAVLNVMFAAAPSQNEFLSALCKDTRIDWTRVIAFHMDEYVGIDPNAPQGFAEFLRARVFSRLPFRSVHCIDCTADGDREAKRYAALLKSSPLDVCFMGVGENGHIAFNDPPVANFFDPLAVKLVALDERCRMQQVHDGCFATIEAVPMHALTVTVPALFAAKEIFCIVPAATKAAAVREMLSGAVGTRCPASILTTHPSARLYLDADSAKHLL